MSKITQSYLIFVLAASFDFFCFTLNCFDMYWADIKVLKSVIKQHNHYVIIYIIELFIQLSYKLIFRCFLLMQEHFYRLMFLLLSSSGEWHQEACGSHCLRRFLASVPGTTLPEEKRQEKGSPSAVGACWLSAPASGLSRER